MAVPVALRLAGRFLGNAISESFAFAAGVAIGPVLSPATQELRNIMNAAYPVVPPPLGALVEGAAEGKIDAGVAAGIAAHHGINQTNFDSLVAIAKTAPDVMTALRALRRQEITPGDFDEVLTLHGVQDKWHKAIAALQAELLAPEELARAIHRGLVPDPGLLQGTLPSGVGHVPAYPVYKIDALREALGSGIDHDRLGVMVGLQGLPMGSHEAAQGFFRSILTRDDFLRAIAEGNTRNEWADAILEQSRQIPTARDFLENALRGYRDLPSAIAGAELHGMSPEHATLIYQNQGRPMAVRSITQALARGGTFKPEPGEIRDPYMAAIVEGNLKPAYYDLAMALRYTMPSVFAIRQLVESKVWDAAKGATRLKWLGWIPQDADEVAAAWAASSSGAAGKSETAATLRAEYEGYLLSEPELRAALTALGYAPAEVDREVHLGDGARVKAYRDKALEAAHKSYVGAQLTSADVQTYLAQLHIDPAAVGELLAVWEIEKALTRKTLTPAQIKAAYRRNTITQAEAIADLEEHGYSAADATTYLAS